jgi:hypothetical protein
MMHVQQLKTVKRIDDSPAHRIWHDCNYSDGLFWLVLSKLELEDQRQFRAPRYVDLPITITLCVPYLHVF